MHSVETRGISLAYDTFGDEADQAILLIAGLGTQMIRWTAPFCEELAARGYRVIRFDNRDAGLSTHLSQYAPPDFGALAAALMVGIHLVVPYTLHDMAADAIGLLDALVISRAHIVGRSMGGMIAQIMTSDYPERVLSLTSIMSSTGNPTLPQASSDVISMMMRPVPDPVSNQGEFLAHSLAFARRISGKTHSLDDQAYRLLMLEETRRAYDPGALGRQLAAMAVTGDRRPRLATIAVPTLVIHGADDPLIVPACGTDTAVSIPDAHLMIIQGMGHDLPPSLYRTIVGAIDQNAQRDCTGAASAP